MSLSFWLDSRLSEKVLRKVEMQFIEYIPKGLMKKGDCIEENKLAITEEEPKNLSN